ncbi:16508_t:CDS:2, partial [Funneliformis geosporum]
NSDESESDSSDVLKTLEINAYDTVNTLYNKNEIEENDREKREPGIYYFIVPVNGEESETLQISISTSYPISNLSEISQATDQQILRKNPIIIEKLVKSCDEYTIDLAILTKLGVIKLLPVRELLTC